MHTYPFHAGDYLKRTAHWSEHEKLVQVKEGLLYDLAYRRLLDLYYSEEGSIPNKSHWVATQIRMLAHVEVVGRVLREKFELRDGKWHQDRANDEIAKYQKRVVANKENGKKGGRKPIGQATANPLGSKPRTRTKNQNQVIPPTPLMGEWFERWYAAYPVKKAKQDALTAFLRLLPDAELFDVLMTAVRLQREAGHFTNASGVPVWPHPATWINKRRWEDELQHAPRAGATPAADGAVQLLSAAGAQTMRNAADAATRIFGSDDGQG